MNHEIFRWTLLIVGAVVTGGMLVALLVVRRSLEPLAALAGITGFSVAIWALAMIAADYARADAILWAVGFFLSAAAGGYALASTLLYRFEGRARERAASLSVPARALPTTAVVVVACVEPDSYDPASTAGMLRELADEGLLDASIAALPFVFFAQKTRYRVVGDRSPAEPELVRITDRLSAVMDRAGARVVWAACSGDEGLAEVVARLAADGHGRIVVAELAVAESMHLVAAKEAVRALRLDEHGVHVTYTQPLYDAERVLSGLAGRVADGVANLVHVGIVLVGHGQPAERSRANPEFDVQEMAFLSRLRMMLIERGMHERHIRIAWTDWGQPDVTSSVRHLAALGCSRVFVLPAAYPLDTLSTRLDVEIAVRQARVDDEITAVTLPAWKDDDAVIEELRARVVSAMESAGA